MHRERKILWLTSALRCCVAQAGRARTLGHSFKGACQSIMGRSRGQQHHSTHFMLRPRVRRVEGVTNAEAPARDARAIRAAAFIVDWGEGWVCASTRQRTEQQSISRARQHTRLWGPRSRRRAWPNQPGTITTVPNEQTRSSCSGESELSSAPCEFVRQNGEVFVARKGCSRGPHQGPSLKVWTHQP